MKLFFCNKTVGKQRMGEPRAGGRKKWEQERSKMHIAHTGRQTGRRKKKKRKSMEDISQRRKMYDRKPLACKKKKNIGTKKTLVYGTLLPGGGFEGHSKCLA